MKTTSIITTAIGCLLVSQSITAQSKSQTIALDNTTLKQIQTFVSPQVFLESPDGKLAFYTDGKHNSIYVKKLGNNTKDKLVYTGNNCGYFASWASDSKHLYMRNKYKEGREYSVQSLQYTFATNQTKERPDIIPQSIIGNYMTESDFKKPVYINNQLQLAKQDVSKKEIILEKNQQCYQPILSPNKKLVAVHIGSQIWIYDVANVNKPYVLGEGLARSWSADSKYLIGHLDTSIDGHQMTGSELYVFDVATKKKMQLTNTKGVYETNPTFTADGTGIYYIDAKTEKAFYCKLKKTK